MLSISFLVRDYRKNLGLTQSELAQISKISLPNIQKIEAGRGNPSFSTLTALLEALGLSISIQFAPVDWDLLAACGAPLLATKKSNLPAPSSQQLLKALRSACLEMKNHTHGTDPRKLEIIQALLLAIRSYYPSFYRLNIHPSPLFLGFFPKKLTGRIIQLKRQSAARLSAFL